MTRPSIIENDCADLYGAASTYTRKNNVYKGRPVWVDQKPFTHWAVQARLSVQFLQGGRIERIDPAHVLTAIVRETVGQNNCGITPDSVERITDPEWGYFLMTWLGVHDAIKTIASGVSGGVDPKASPPSSRTKAKTPSSSKGSSSSRSSAAGTRSGIKNS